MDAVLNAFQWGNERSVLLIDGLDRLGNALGDAGMLDAFRSMCDGIRFNDHVALVTTDLEMFETAVQRRLLADVTLLRTSDVEAWTNDPDGLWDHPLLLAPDEEEEQWLAAQIEHQGRRSAPPYDQNLPLREVRTNPMQRNGLRQRKSSPMWWIAGPPLLWMLTKPPPPISLQEQVSPSA